MNKILPQDYQNCNNANLKQHDSLASRSNMVNHINNHTKIIFSKKKMHKWYLLSFNWLKLKSVIWILKNFIKEIPDFNLSCSWSQFQGKYPCSTSWSSLIYHSQCSICFDKQHVKGAGAIPNTIEYLNRRTTFFGYKNIG